MPITNPIVPNYSSRGIAVPPPKIVKVTPPPVQQEVSQPFDYNRRAPLPVYVAPSQPVSIQRQVEQLAVIDTTEKVTSQFSPNIETFMSGSNSYFSLSAEVSKQAAEWATFPATSNIEMQGYDITGATNVSTVEVTATIVTSTTVNTSNITSSVVNVSTINANTIVTSNITAQVLQGGLISTPVGVISSIITSIITLDNANLTTAGGTELLLNGVPLATISNVPDVAEWSLDPAISDVQMGTYKLIRDSNTSNYIQVDSGTGTMILNAQGIALSSNVTVGTTSNSRLQVQQITPIGGAFGTSGQVLGSDGSNLVWTTAGGSGSPTTWANYPAISDVILPDRNLFMCNAGGGSGGFSVASLNATVNIGNVANAPNRPDFNAYVTNFNIGSLVSPAASINMTSLGGINLNSLVGVSLAGGGGVSIAGIGGITLTGAGGIVVTAGGIAVNGGGISVAAGGIAINGGVVQAGGGILVTGGEVSLPSAKITMGPDSNASIVMGTASESGGSLTMYGGDMNLYSSLARQSRLNVPYIEMIGGSTGSFINSSNNNLAINGLSTINGAAYPPPGSSNNPNLLVSTVTAASYISTPSIVGVSTINGLAYPPPGTSNSPEILVSTVTAATYISTANMFSDYYNGITDLHLGYLAGATGDITIGANTDEIFLTAPTIIGTANISSITNVSTINGVAYPPPGASNSPEILVSTVIAAVYISTPSIIGVSTINGAVYPPPGGTWVPNATSALNMGNYPINNALAITGLSSINNVAYPPPIGWVGTATSALNMSNYAIYNAQSVATTAIAGLSTINAVSYPSPPQFYTYYVALNGSDISNNGSAYSPFRTIAYAISKVPLSYPTFTNGYTIIIAPGIYNENLNISSKCIVFQGMGTQDSEYNTTIQGDLTYASSSVGIRYETAVEFKNLQLIPNVTNTVAMINLSTTTPGAMTFNNCRFGDAGVGSAVGWIASQSVCDVIVTMNNCTCILTGEQTFTGPAFQFAGVSQVYIQNTYIEVNQAVSAIQMNGQSILTMANCTVANDTPTIAADGSIFFYSTITSPLSHVITNTSFRCASTGATGQAAIKAWASGQTITLINNSFSVRAGGATYAVTSTGTGTTLTSINYFRNALYPGTSGLIGPIVPGTFEKNALTELT